MFCGECGTQNPDTNQFCKNCGRPLRRAQQAPAPQPAATPPPVQVMPAPAPAVPAIQAPGSAPVPPAVRGTAKPPRNWFAIVSLMVSLVSWLVYPIIIGFIALVLGIFSLYQAKKRQTKVPISAITAIIIGFLAIVLNLFWLDIFPAPAVLPPIK